MLHALGDVWSDLVRDLGGADNLLAGMGSVALAALVGVFAAWAILAGIRRHERRLATELDARASARALLVTVEQTADGVGEMLGNGIDEGRRQQLVLRFGVATRTHIPALMAVDADTVNGLRVLGQQIETDLLALPLGEVREGTRSEQASLRLGADMGSFTGLLAQWIRERQQV